MLQEGSVVAVLRKCQRCEKWRTMGCYRHNGKVCSSCYKSWLRRPGAAPRARGLVITESGRELLRQIHAEEAAAASAA